MATDDATRALIAKLLREDQATHMQDDDDSYDDVVHVEKSGGNGRRKAEDDAAFVPRKGPKGADAVPPRRVRISRKTVPDGIADNDDEDDDDDYNDDAGAGEPVVDLSEQSPSHPKKKALAKRKAPSSSSSSSSGGGGKQPKQRKTTGQLTTLSQLLQSGLLESGGETLTISYLNHTFNGTLLETGQIEHVRSTCPQAKEIVGCKYPTPSAWSIMAKRILFPGKLGDNGWTSVVYRGVPLAKVKDYFESCDKPNAEAFWADTSVQRKTKAAPKAPRPAPAATFAAPKRALPAAAKPRKIYDDYDSQESSSGDEDDDYYVNGPPDAVANPSSPQVLIPRAATATTAGGTIVVAIPMAASPTSSEVGTSAGGNGDDDDDDHLEMLPGAVGSASSYGVPASSKHNQDGDDSDDDYREANNQRSKGDNTADVDADENIRSRLRKPKPVIYHADTAEGGGGPGADAHDLIRPDEFHPDDVPFELRVSTQALVTMDFHSHLSHVEVIGFLAGSWDPEARVLVAEDAYPCRALDNAHNVAAAAVAGETDADQNRETNVEMDPTSEMEVRAEILEQGLMIVGWYHSHPVFEASPSVRDIENQRNYQKLFQCERTQLNPFVGAIISPYNAKSRSESSSVCFFVTDEPVVRPMEMPVKVFRLDKVPHLEHTLKLKKVAALLANAPERVQLDGLWKAGIGRREKLRSSLMSHLISTQCAKCSESDAEICAPEEAVVDELCRTCL